MANTYNEPDKIRQHNGQQFIDDFKRAKTIIVFAYNSETTFEVQKQDVWDIAKQMKLHYNMDYCPYTIHRTCMTIL